MGRRTLHLQPPCLTVRRLVILWAVSVFLAWAVLVTGWLVARERLAAISGVVLLEVRVLNMVRELELVVLAERRADLLWQVTEDSPYQERRDTFQVIAGQIAESLGMYMTSDEERELLAGIREQIRLLYELSASPTRVPQGMVSETADRLLILIGRLHDRSRSQMEESVQAATRTFNVIGYAALGLAGATAVLLLAGSVIVIRRVVRPTLALTDAARAFGRGQFSARATVLYEDELGTLARTFNNMAEDIADRERNRLEFVAMVVHDLKNPVLAVQMAGRMLRVATNDDPKCRPYLDGIDTETKRLRAIVQDLMDDVQVASGRFSVQKTAVHLCGLVRQLMQDEARTFSEHKIAVEIQEGCVVLGDARRIERVVVNLVSNAVKYSPPGTQVTVRVWREEPFAVLGVADQGPGISREDREMLFQPFGRGRSPGAGIEGTGMGLYVVKQIVEAHGGQIELESEPGRGTVFRVKLPLAGEG